MSNPLADLPGYKLRRSAQAQIGILSDRLAQLGLRLSEASVLLLVGERLDITASEIGRELDILRANMVPLLKRLEKAGLAARRPIDRKSSAVILTQEGLARLDLVKRIVATFEEDLLARVPAEHQEHFEPILDALLQPDGSVPVSGKVKPKRRSV